MRGAYASLSLALRARSLRSRLCDSNRPTSFTRLLADRACVDFSNGPRMLETEAISFRVPLLAPSGKKDLLEALAHASSVSADLASLELTNRLRALEVGAASMLVPIGVLGRDKDTCLLLVCLLVLVARACLLVDCRLALRGPRAAAPRAAAALAGTHASEWGGSGGIARWLEARSESATNV